MIKLSAISSQQSAVSSFVGTVIVCLFVILLIHPLLCFGENIDGDKLELSPQTEEGTSTTTESETMGTESSSDAIPAVSVSGTESSTGTLSAAIEKSIQPQAELIQSMPAATVTTTVVSQGEQSQGDSTSDRIATTSVATGIASGTKSSSVGSPTLLSQPSESTATTTPQVDAVPPSRILSAVKSWMIAFSGEPIITGNPSITGLMLIPTAYRLDKQRKLNIDFVFTYYIGEFWNKTEYKESKYENIEIFNPINRLSCSGDFKYNLIPEKKWIPAVAFGYHSFIVLQGKASNAGQMGGAVSKQSNSFGYIYGVLSKSFKSIGFHIGNQSGPIGKLINPISNKLTVTSDRAFIAGLNTTICKRTTFVEIIYPQKKECIMINTFIDKFLPFNFTYIKFNNKLSTDALNGYSMSGYFRIRIPAFPGEKKEKKK